MIAILRGKLILAAAEVIAGKRAAIALPELLAGAAQGDQIAAVRAAGAQLLLAAQLGIRDDDVAAAVDDAWRRCPAHPLGHALDDAAVRAWRGEPLPALVPPHDWDELGDWACAGAALALPATAGVLADRGEDLRRALALALMIGDPLRAARLCRWVALGDRGFAARARGALRVAPPVAPELQLELAVLARGPV